MRNLRAALLLLLAASLDPAGAQAQNDFGLLVMAHGGTDEWNQTILDAVAPLAAELPVEVAFGMADADRMQTAVAALEAAGVRRIGVARLFIDGNSFLERTEKILGLRPGAPPESERESSPIPGMRMALYLLETDAEFALLPDGLNLAPETETILRDRAAALSEPGRAEVLVVIGHGAGSQQANELLAARAAERALPAVEELGFEDLRSHSLAEDWSDLREPNEAAIRADIEAILAAGQTPIVVPFRVSGFGPYAKVLDGLDYVSDGRGLLPHPAITDWLRSQADQLRRRFPAGEDTMLASGTR